MVRIPGKLIRQCGLGLASAGGAAVLCFAVAVPGPNAQQRSSDGPLYTPNGNLVLPTGYDTWVFVGANVGLAYTDAAAAAAAATPRPADRQLAAAGASPGVQPAPRQFFHNVSIIRWAYDAFQATGQFPDKTVLVMQVFEAANKEPRNVLAAGVYNGRRAGLEVAVKNLSRPDGSRTPWAYYNFTNPQDSTRLLASAPAFPDSDCANCHVRHAGFDNVWVQFYPVLRARLQTQTPRPPATPPRPGAPDLRNSTDGGSQPDSDLPPD
jgi:hypothetical protein